MNKVRYISIGGILTAIAVICQSAPVFFPAIGLLISPFSTLPLAIATFYNLSLGIAVFFSSAVILTLVNIQEAMILLFTTGPLGIVIGIFLYRKGLLVSILFSSIILTLGMISLTYIVRIELINFESIPLTFIIFVSFALIYASIWTIGIRKLIDYFIKIKLLNK